VLRPRHSLNKTARPAGQRRKHLPTTRRLGIEARQSPAHRCPLRRERPSKAPRRPLGRDLPPHNIALPLSTYARHAEPRSAMTKRMLKPQMQAAYDWRCAVRTDRTNWQRLCACTTCGALTPGRHVVGLAQLLAALCRLLKVLGRVPWGIEPFLTRGRLLICCYRLFEGLCLLRHKPNSSSNLFGKCTSSSPMTGVLCTMTSENMPAAHPVVERSLLV
jgi:hypothetical protein